MALSKVSFTPTESVTYMPDNNKQQVTMTITNDGTQTITFKMKSTRPGRYKMRPVYGKVPPGDHTNVQLIYKGVNPSIKKHKWAILYKGYNDQPLEMAPAQNEISDVRVTRIKKGRGLIDEEDERAAAAAAPGQTKEQVQLLFREQACPLSDSVTDSDRENDHEEEKQTSKKLHAPPPTDKSAAAVQDLPTAPMAKLGITGEATAQPPTDVSKLMTAPPAKLGK